ncbi:hypothetical protein CWB96_23070, partial [Pseudoalteromonas citrea]
RHPPPTPPPPAPPRFFFLLILRPSISTWLLTIFPYKTLFRSHGIVYAKMPGNHMLTGHQKGV